ncbi:uncharacterized protein TNCV_2273011 [Trichonephila clavipes]|nr:uncharacterized protein TNCV_2273011 [Trichonephila clavipes]
MVLHSLNFHTNRRTFEPQCVSAHFARRVFSGTRLELTTLRSRVGYLDHLATSATWTHSEDIGSEYVICEREGNTTVLFGVLQRILFCTLRGGAATLLSTNYIPARGWSGIFLMVIGCRGDIRRQDPAIFRGVRVHSDEAHFWLNGYGNKQNCRIWSEDNPQVYVETPLHPEKLTVWCALWAGGILLQKR